MQHWKQLLQACLLLLAFSTSAAADDAIVRLATTTSTANSGLLDYLLPKFEQTGIGGTGRRRQPDDSVIGRSAG